MSGRFSVIGVVATTASMLLMGAPQATAAYSDAGEESINYEAWSSADTFNAGRFDGTTVEDNALALSDPVGVIERTEPDLGTTRTYEYGQWISPKHALGFPATELIASWNADTPDDTWLQVEGRGNTTSGEQTGWYILGQWAEGDTDILRTSVQGQDDAHAKVNVDTLATKEGVTLESYQVRVTLYRAQETSNVPTVSLVGAMGSNVPDRFDVPISEPGAASGVELAVPRYSQNIHKGHYPEYGGGGEVWCSPTSTEMVVEFHGAGPSEDELSWIPENYVDPSVAHAARFTYDYTYEGTGNWPFNTAFAARYGLQAHVTRLHSLSDVEDYILRGVPVITSQSFLAKELDGAGYGTEGHLMVVIGFTEDGDVIVNDPAASSNDAVRKVYPRAQFERIWQRTQRYDAEGNLASGSGGVAYVISPNQAG